MKREDDTTPPDHLETSQPRTVKKDAGDSPLTKETFTLDSSEESQASLHKRTSEQSVSSVSLSGNFGRYRIKELLGAGAMGAVYLAEDSQLQRQVALKTPSFTGDNPELLERFYREARSAATLNNKNICTVFDVGEINKTHYISMAYIEGRPLSDFIHSEKLQSSRQVAKLIRKLSLALQEAHEAGVVHRDLKPDNIMVDAKGEPVIMDFGLARQTNITDARMTQSGAIMGTPAYMAPEQVRGEQEVIGPLSDQYSLGVVLYEMMCGKRPFSGALGVVMSQILTEIPASPTTVQSKIDPALEVICLKMMQKEQADRYDSMKEVASALATYLKQSISAPRKNSVQKTKKQSKKITSEEKSTYLPVLQTTALPQIRRTPQKKKTKSAGEDWVSRKVIYGIGAALLGVLLLAGILLMLQTSDGTVVVELAEGVSDDIKIEITQNGKVHIIEKKKNWTINITAGTYQVNVQGGNDQFKLNKDEVVVSRKQEQIVKVTLKTSNPIKNPKPNKTEKPPQKTDEPKSSIQQAPQVYFTTFAGHTSRGLSVAISPDGKMGLTAGYDDKAFLWDLVSKKLLRKIDFDSPALDGQFLADKKRILTSEQNGQVMLWDLKTNKRVRDITQMEMLPYARLFFIPGNSKSIVTAGHGYWFRLFDLETGKVKLEQKILEEGVAVDGFALSQDGQFFASGGTSRIVKVWSLKTGKMTAQLKGAASTVRAIVFSSDGKYLFAAGGKEGDQPQGFIITKWDIKTNKLIQAFEGHQGTVFSLGLLPDGKRLISSSQVDKTPFIWEIKTGKKLGEIPYPGDRLLRFALSPNGKHLLTRDSNKNVYYLDISKWK